MLLMVIISVRVYRKHISFMGSLHLLSVLYIGACFVSVSAGSFEACGNTYKLDAAKTAINPVHVVHASSWSLKYPPIVSWIAESGAIYTLVVWNVGRLSLQGFFINIRGSSLDQGEVGETLLVLSSTCRGWRGGFRDTELKYNLSDNPRLSQS